jgi:mannosyl-3-phosphoglycerate synthase
MILEIPREVERFGAIQFGGLQKVYELDSGPKKKDLGEGKSVIRQVCYEELHNVQKKTAIVVPVRSERLKLVEGVLCGIPHQCLIIIVSNSPRKPVDRFQIEQDALNDFCIFVRKNALIIHQKDETLASALKAAGYDKILNKRGEIRDGKAEGMIVGVLLAALAGRKYIGFIDADNYFPGSVEEYIREYAAGFIMNRSKYSMVRIAWHSKPKIVKSKLFFRKWGRVSENTNRLLNGLISHYTGYETGIIKTGNAGEHAMTMDLALCLDYSTGYSIEPFEILDLLEKFGGIKKSLHPEILGQRVKVCQIESRNPHLHEVGDSEHISSMSFNAMQAIYHSEICPEQLKRQILSSMYRQKMIEKGKEPPKLIRFPSLNRINMKKFLKNLKNAPYARLIHQGI